MTRQKRKINYESSEECLTKGQSSTSINPLQKVFGWNTEDEAAATVWSSIHSTLVNGNLVFAYRGMGDLKQVIVVQNLDREYYKPIGNDFGVGLITSGWTCLLPHIPIEYLETELLDDLINYKVDKKIIETYKQIINDYSNKL